MYIHVHYVCVCRLVVDALKAVDPNRKCFHMVGSVLSERTAKEVIPSLQHNIDQVCTCVGVCNESVSVWIDHLDVCFIGPCLY